MQIRLWFVDFQVIFQMTPEISAFAAINSFSRTGSLTMRLSSDKKFINRTVGYFVANTCRGIKITNQIIGVKPRPSAIGITMLFAKVLHQARGKTSTQDLICYSCFDCILCAGFQINRISNINYGLNRGGSIHQSHIRLRGFFRLHIGWAFNCTRWPLCKIFLSMCFRSFQIDIAYNNQVSIPRLVIFIVIRFAIIQRNRTNTFFRSEYNPYG
jgi:hypothetical protein